MSETVKLHFYRHKEFKEAYLVRGNYCGGSESTQFYDITNNVIDAIRSYEGHSKDFMSWYHSFPNNYTMYHKKMEFEWDGYKGTLCKEIKLFIKDFELVTLDEVANEQTD